MAQKAVQTERGEHPEAASALGTAVPGAGPAAAAETSAVPVTPATTLAHAKASVPRWVQLPYAIVFAVAAGGLAWTWLGPRHLRAGMLAVASAVLAGALLRLVLPERRAGLLLSRRRLLDVLVLASLGASIMAVVLVLPSSS